MEAPMIKKISIVPVVIGLSLACAWAGPKFTFNDGKSDCELTQSYQVWAAYTRDEGDVPSTDSRADLFLKQGRVGVKGHALPALSFSTLFAFDNLGKDQYTGSLGTAQATTNNTFLLYDFFMTYALDTTFANITFGYFRPQTGHENIAPDAGVNSLDKGLTSMYLRSFLTGRTSGRETGVNVGGFYGCPLYGIAYNCGAFDPTQALISGTDGGSRKWHPLLTGRLAISLFQPDMPSYRLSPEINFFGTRKGITFGGHYSYQKATDETWDTSAVKYDNVKSTYSGAVKYVGGFQKNGSFGGDFVASFMGLSLDGEYDVMSRSVNGVSYHGGLVKAPAADFSDRVFHLRAGYDIPLPKDQFIEPAIMYTEFDGASASTLYPSGIDHILDMGLNWYVNKNNFKIAAHYIKQGGSPKSNYESAAPDAKGNVTVRGDMAAVNFQVQF
jgi:hypothetical protein